jgi:hypothetical protein
MSMKEIPRIPILSPSTRWRSSLEFHLQQALNDQKLLAAIDFQDLLKEVRKNRPAVAIAEIEVHQVQDICIALQKNLEECSPALFVAVGEPSLKPWLSCLRAGGFTEVCVEISGLSSMCSRLARHIQATQLQQTEPLESRILELLPWYHCQSRRSKES